MNGIVETTTKMGINNGFVTIYHEQHDIYRTQQHDNNGDAPYITNHKQINS